MSEQSQGGFPVRIIGGAIYGAIAYAVSFVAVVALYFQRVRDSGADLPDIIEQLEGQEHFVDLLGWIFYNAHTVDIAVTAEGFGGSTSTTLTLVGEPYVSDTTIFHAIPAVALFAAGYVVAMRTPHRLDLVSGAIAGASVTIGYGALAYFGTSLFSATEQGLTVEPAMPAALYVVALAYPAVAGGLGGALKGL